MIDEFDETREFITPLDPNIGVIERVPNNVELVIQTKNGALEITKEGKKYNPKNGFVDIPNDKS